MPPNRSASRAIKFASAIRACRQRMSHSSSARANGSLVFIVRNRPRRILRGSISPEHKTMSAAPNAATEYKPKKIVLAYSGGLDTSVILPWLKERYPGVKLVAFACELGQGDELSGIEKKAYASGADEVVVMDLREEFARDYCFPMLRAHAIYEQDYLPARALPARSSRPSRSKSPTRPAPTRWVTAPLARATTRSGSN